MEQNGEDMRGRGETGSSGSEVPRPGSLSPLFLGSSFQLNTSLEAILLRVLEQMGILSTRFGPGHFFTSQLHCVQPSQPGGSGVQPCLGFLLNSL